MNAAKAIELCYARTLRKYAELGANVKIRPWQSLRDDGSWKHTAKEGDRRFPCVDIRCAPPSGREDTGVNFDGTCIITCAHIADEDKDHALTSAMFEEVEKVLLRIFAQWWQNDATGAERAYWDAQWADLLGANYALNGITNGEPVPPDDGDNLLMIGASQIISYTRADI